MHTTLTRGLFAAFLAIAVSSQAAMAAAPFQGMFIGATYDMEETYGGQIAFGQSGDEIVINGSISITADTSYEVVGMETYTQTCPAEDFTGTTGTYNVYKVHYTGTANLNGTVDIAANVSGLPFPINGNGIGLRIRNARFDGYLWLRDTDLATVAKKREIEGAAESNAQLGFGGIVPGANWSTLAPVLRANQFEEYILPLEEYRWPLETTNPSYAQNPSICAHGDYYLEYDVFGLLSDSLTGDFGEVIDINFTVDVPDKGTETLENGETVEYYQARESTNDFAQPASQNFYYSPNLRFIIRQEIVNLAIGGLLTLNDATLQVVDFEVPAVAETQLRALHLSPNAPSVDVYANGASIPAVEDLSFPNGTQFLTLTPGTYTLDVAPANTSVGQSVLNVPGLNLAQDKQYTAAVIGKLSESSFRALLLEDNLSTPAAGNIRIRAIHGAADVGQVDIWNVTDAGNPSALYTDVNYGDVGAYAEIPAGSYKLGFDTNNDGTPELTFTTPNLAAGSVLNVFAVSESASSVNLVAQTKDGATLTITPDPIGPSDDAGLEIWAEFTNRVHTVDLRVFNNTSSNINMQLWVALDIAGQFLFFPAFSEVPSPVVPAVDFPANVDLGRFNLFTLPIPDALGADVPVTWYGLIIDLGNGNVVGELESSTCTLN